MNRIGNGSTASGSRRGCRLEKGSGQPLSVSSLVPLRVHRKPSEKWMAEGGKRPNRATLRPLTSELRSPFQRDLLLRGASGAERNTGPMKSPSLAKIRLDYRPQAYVASSQSRVRFGGAIVVLVLGRAGAASAKRCTSNPGMFRTMLRSPRKSQVAGTPTWSDISRASR